MERERREGGKTSGVTHHFRYFTNFITHKIIVNKYPRLCFFLRELKSVSDSTVIFYFFYSTNSGFASTTLHDWLKKLAPLFHPVRSRTNRDALARVFPRFSSATCYYFELWLVDWIVCVLCDWLELFTLVLDYQHSFKNRSSFNGSSDNLFTYSPVQHAS